MADQQSFLLIRTRYESGEEIDIPAPPYDRVGAAITHPSGAGRFTRMDIFRFDAPSLPANVVTHQGIPVTHQGVPVTYTP